MTGPPLGPVNPWPIIRQFITHQRLLRKPNAREVLGIFQNLANVTGHNQSQKITETLAYCRRQRLFSEAAVEFDPTRLPNTWTSNLSSPARITDAIAPPVENDTYSSLAIPLEEGQGETVCSSLLCHAKMHHQWQVELQLPATVAAHYSVIRAHQGALYLKRKLGLQSETLVRGLDYTPRTADYLLTMAIKYQDLPLALNFLYNIVSKGGRPTDPVLDYLWRTVQRHNQLYTLLTAPTRGDPPDPLTALDLDTYNTTPVHDDRSLDSEPCSISSYLWDRTFYVYQLVMQPWLSSSSPRLVPPEHMSSTDLAPFSKVTVPVTTTALPSTTIQVLDQILLVSNTEHIQDILTSLVHQFPYHIHPPFLNGALHTLCQYRQVQLTREIFTSYLAKIYRQNAPNPPRPGRRQRTLHSAATTQVIPDQFPYTESYELFRRDHPGYPPPVDRRLFNTILGAWLKRRRLGEATQILVLMRHCGISPGIDTWNILIKGLFALHRPEYVVDIWLHLKPLTIDRKKPVPDQVSLRGNRKWRLFKWMGPPLPPSPETYQLLLNGFGQMGKLRDMLDVYHQLEADPKVEPTRQHFSTLLIYLNRYGNVDDVLQRLRHLVEGLEVNRVAPQYRLGKSTPPNNEGKVSSPDDTHKLRTTLTVLYPTTAVFNDLIKSLGASRQFDLALQVFEGLCTAWEREPTASVQLHHSGLVDLKPGTIPRGSSDNPQWRSDATLATVRQPNIVTYNNLIALFLRHGEDAKAHRILELIQRGTILPTAATYTLFIQSYLQRGWITQAQDMWHDMVDHHNINPSASALNAFLVYYEARIRLVTHPGENVLRDLNAKAALEWYDRFAYYHLVPSPLTVNVMVALCVKIHRWPLLSELLQVALRTTYRVPVPILTHVLKTLVEESAFPTAHYVYQNFYRLSRRHPSPRLVHLAKIHRIAG
ncbi:hypothetical protein IWQ61_005162 [Dispira simplex]|nr:hypothetical protein IWQ61_005162 [Dispira simplex]